MARVVIMRSHTKRDHRKRAVPASASLSIAAVADQVGGVELPDPVALAPDLRDVLAGVVDPRKRRGSAMAGRGADGHGLRGGGRGAVVGGGRGVGR
jgi:hypothetical protein